MERLQANGLLNLSTLLNLIDESVIGWWNANQTDPKNKIIMMPFKSEHIQNFTNSAESRETNRIITYRKIRKNYGTLDNDPFGSKKEVRPRLREEKIVRDNNGNTVGVKIYGRWYDVLVRFDCFAPSWTEAAQLEEDFDMIMDIFSGFIMQAGINKMEYRGTFSDTFHVKTDYFYEPIHYYFRLEKQYYVYNSLLEEIRLNVNDKINSILN